MLYVTPTLIQGASLAYTFAPKIAKAPSPHKTEYFEMFGDLFLSLGKGRSQVEHDDC